MNGSAGSAWPIADTPSGGRKLPEGTSPTGMTPDGRKVTVGLENAATAWQTPRVTSGEYTRDRGQKGAERPTLEGEAVMWGTPRASDAEKGGPNQAFGAGGTPLPAQAAQWPTPMAGTPAQNGNSAAGSSDFSRKADLLAAGVLASSWPTPAAQNVKGSSEGSITRADGKSRMDILHYRAEQGFSHPDPETQPHGRPSFLEMRALHRLLAAAGLFRHPKGISRPWAAPTRSRPRNSARAAWRVAESYRRWSEKRRRYWAPRLSPLFVGSLMGWPSGHALCDCSATEFSRWRQHMRGALSALPTASGAWIWAPPKETPRPVQIEMFGG